LEIRGGGFPAHLRIPNPAPRKSAPRCALNAAWLRSSGIELTGSGIGSAFNEQLAQITGRMLQSAGAAKLAISTLAAQDQADRRSD
jgi:secreted protein with Ig-like and vWFA domain